MITGFLIKNNVLSAVLFVVLPLPALQSLIPLLSPLNLRRLEVALNTPKGKGKRYNVMVVLRYCVLLIEATMH